MTAHALRRECARPFSTSDRRILDVAPHPHRGRLEAFDRKLGARGGLEREIILEEIVVPVHVRDGQHLQQQLSCRASGRAIAGFELITISYGRPLTP